MKLNKSIGGKSEDEKFNDAIRYLPLLLMRFPEFSDFQLNDIITNFKEYSSESRREMIDCQNQLKRLLYDKSFVKQGSFNLQLQLTEHGRMEKARLIDEAQFEHRKQELSGQNFTFNEYMNFVIEYLSSQSTHLSHPLIWHHFKYNYPKFPLNEVVAELKRLSLVNIDIDRRSFETYLLKQPVKRQIEILPNEFIDKPYEYFIDQEEKKESKNEEKNNLELQKLRDEVLDYESKLNREKTHKKIAFIILIIETIGVLIAMLK